MHAYHNMHALCVCVCVCVCVCACVCVCVTHVAFTVVASLTYCTALRENVIHASNLIRVMSSFE